MMNVLIIDDDLDKQRSIVTAMRDGLKMTVTEHLDAEHYIHTVKNNGSAAHVLLATFSVQDRILRKVAPIIDLAFVDSIRSDGGNAPSKWDHNFPGPDNARSLLQYAPQCRVFCYSSLMESTSVMVPTYLWSLLLNERRVVSAKPQGFLSLTDMQRSDFWPTVMKGQTPDWVRTRPTAAQLQELAVTMLHRTSQKEDGEYYHEPLVRLFADAREQMLPTSERSGDEWSILGPIKDAAAKARLRRSLGPEAKLWEFRKISAQLKRLYAFDRKSHVAANKKTVNKLNASASRSKTGRSSTETSAQSAPLTSD